MQSITILLILKWNFGIVLNSIINFNRSINNADDNMLCLNFIANSGNSYNLEELTSVDEQQINDGETKYRVFVY